MNLNLEDLFEYCNSVDKIGLFCRDICQKIIITPDKKAFNHSHIIFFSEENIKRLINSEHILIDCTYVYPKNYHKL